MMFADFHNKKLHCKKMHCQAASHATHYVAAHRIDELDSFLIR